MTSADICCRTLPGVSGREVHDTSTLSQRETLRFFISAVQAEYRGEIFSASLKVGKFIGKILIFL